MDSLASLPKKTKGYQYVYHRSGTDTIYYKFNGIEAYRIHDAKHLVRDVLVQLCEYWE